MDKLYLSAIHYYKTYKHAQMLGFARIFILIKCLVYSCVSICFYICARACCIYYTYNI